MKISWNNTERALVLGSRYLTAIAVVGSLAGSVLMFLLGLAEIFRAFQRVLYYADTEDTSFLSTTGVIGVIEALDRFLIALVLLYFAYGVYSLFIHPEREPAVAEQEFALPAWLRVRRIGQLKQVVAEVIVVILFVLFLRVVLLVFEDPNLNLSWRQMGAIALLPVCAALLALALRLVELHPKPPGRQPSDGGHDREQER